MKTILILTAVALCSCKEDAPKTAAVVWTEEDQRKADERTIEIKSWIAENDREIDRLKREAAEEKDADARMAEEKAKREADYTDHLASKRAKSDARIEAIFAESDRRREAEKSERDAERRNRDLIRAIEGTRR